MLRDAPILVLDESVSMLDAISERDLQRAVAEVRAGRTALVIAHRLSTILAADRIVVLEQGRVVGAGTHTDLLEDCPAYARLIDAQWSPTPNAWPIGRPGAPSPPPELHTAPGRVQSRAVRRPDRCDRRAGTHLNRQRTLTGICSQIVRSVLAASLRLGSSVAAHTGRCGSEDQAAPVSWEATRWA
ncbi:MAG: hypothetical protein ACRD0K_17175 [Egibacteraceae bacterium]